MIEIARERLLREVETRLSESPVTILLGARQTGKTTLAHMVARRRDQVRFFDLEVAADRMALSATPEKVLSEASGLVVLDEIQRMPALFEVLRPLADRPSSPARFLLLGSASPELVRGTSESLAGRALFLHIPGFMLEEAGSDGFTRGAPHRLRVQVHRRPRHVALAGDRHQGPRPRPRLCRLSRQQALPARRSRGSAAFVSPGNGD